MRLENEKYSEGVNISGGETSGGETSWGKTVWGVNHPGGESSVGVNKTFIKGWTTKGVKRPGSIWYLCQNMYPNITLIFNQDSAKTMIYILKPTRQMIKILVWRNIKW